MTDSDSSSILVVDDNPANLKLVRVLLMSVGERVVTAVDADDALRALQQEHPALILMDLQMPGMDGLALTRQLKADPGTRHIVVIALTAYAMKGDAERAFEAGCDDYMSKPIDLDALTTLVARWMAKVEDTPAP